MRRIFNPLFTYLLCAAKYKEKIMMNTQQLRHARTSQEWLTYYQANAEQQLHIPWKEGCRASSLELARILPSLRAWQLGETSDGAHLLKAAKNYGDTVRDPHFVDVARLFIKEEQRHGEMLGRYVEAAGRKRMEKNWGDTLFRKVRYAFPSMEIWVMPVIMVETIALIYYQAIHDATNCKLLRVICRQILHDEVAHIRFQYERLAILHSLRSRPYRLAIHLLHRLLFAIVCVAVWIGHARALQAGGHSLLSFWDVAWRKMRSSWRRMNPDLYLWEQQSNSAAPQSTNACINGESHDTEVAHSC
jgi:hypothetical protein